MSIGEPFDKNVNPHQGIDVGHEESSKAEGHPHHAAHPKPHEHHKTEAEKVEDKIQASLSPEAAGDAIKIVRTRPDLAPYFTNVEKDAASIESALIQGKKAASSLNPDKKDITGVSSGYERLAEGAFEVQASEAVKTSHHHRTEIEDVNDTSAIVVPVTPRHAMREKTYADLPPFPNRNNNA